VLFDWVVVTVLFTGLRYFLLLFSYLFSISLSVQYFRDCAALFP